MHKGARQFAAAALSVYRRLQRIEASSACDKQFVALRPEIEAGAFVEHANTRYMFQVSQTLRIKIRSNESRLAFPPITPREFDRLA